MLFNNRNTTYTIVVAEDASPSEKTAAKDLQTCLKQISGADFPISNIINNVGNCIYVGYNDKVASLTGFPRPEYSDESFVYKAAGNDIVIMGGGLRGTMYGVYSFLEREFVVRWYTKAFTKVPRMKSWAFDVLEHSESPAIRYRYTMYYDTANVPEWAAYNKNNLYWNLLSNEYGGCEACLGAHSIGELLPEEEFFKSHPEYFAMRNGKRQGNAQRCLSNPEVVRIIAERVTERIERNPGYMLYDVSQLDNQLYCECSECRSIESRYGGEHSGIILWMVNQVADEVRKRFPNKKICTFAYHYSRHAPKNIKPRENVVIRLCDIECCFAHPLEECELNKSFVADLKDWSQISKEIFIWDYVVNFGHYIAPYPNFAVLAENIRTFRRYGVTTVLEQGQRQSNGGEFADLKAWVLARLLWNPDQDTNALVREFIRDYYGTVAPYIQQYYDMCQNAVTPDIHIFENKNACGIFSDTFVNDARALLDKALAKAKTKDLKRRVEDVRAQILYLQTVRDPVKSKINGTSKEFRNYVRKYKPQINERIAADDFLQIDGYI